MASPGVVDQSPAPPLASRPRLRPLLPKSRVPPASQSATAQITKSPRGGPGDNVISIESDSEGSELTPLPSPLEAKWATTNQAPKKTASLLWGSTQTVPLTPHQPAAPHLVDLEPWSVDKLGSYVWVILDPRARVFEPEDGKDPSQCDKERLWWPGKITSKSSKALPLKVRLFGTLPAKVKSVEIRSPCQLNILSLKDSNHRDRFTIPTFISSMDPGRDLITSPRKKIKHDRAEAEDRWRVAVTEMVQEREEEANGSDVLPEVGTLEFVSVLSAPTPIKGPKGTPMMVQSQKGKGRKRKRTEFDEDDMEVDHLTPLKTARWSPEPADETLQIPDELILAIEKGGDSVFWPAKILAYVPPKRPRKEGKYRVEFLDTTKKDIPRSWFYTFNDKEFATCQIGQWESEYREVVDDVDDADDMMVMDRSPSPLPRNPPPSGQEFHQLDVREKFAYTKPVLQAILKAEYVPARRRHDLFLGGGDGRDKVKKDAGLRGRMDPEEVGKLGEYLCEWCLRDERRAKKVVEEEPMNGKEEPGCSAIAKAEGEANDEAIIMDKPTEGELLKPRSLSPTDTEQLSPSQGDFPPNSSVCHSEDLDSPGVCIPPPRQYGCEGYEALSGEEKISYCLNVLLPEAVLQLLLWCQGSRTSLDILTEDEETDLHAEGERLLKETDWVNDVKRLREKARSLLRLGAEGSKGAGKDDREWTSTGRPKRSAAKSVSYRE